VVIAVIAVLGVAVGFLLSTPYPLETGSPVVDAFVFEMEMGHPVPIDGTAAEDPAIAPEDGERLASR
jgi:hypothetical protein